MRIVFTCLLLAGCLAVFGQNGKEGRVPLGYNPMLQQHQSSGVIKTQNTNRNGFGKAPFNDFTFPLVDWFDKDTTEVNVLLWKYNLVKTQNGAAVLNAQDSTHTTYSPANGSVGMTDYLESQAINIQNSNGKLFLSFIYSTGPTWKPTDVLAVEFRNQSGVFTNVWTGGSIAANHIPVVIPVDLSSFISDSFAIKFVLTTERSNTNTATFLLHNVNLTDGLSLPWYENFSIPDFKFSSWASPVNWQRALVHLIDDGVQLSKTAVFNAYDNQGDLYTNNGYADTLLSQPLDLTGLKESDSSFLTFSVRKFPASTSTDTLLLEFLDTADVWNQVWITGASQADLSYTILSRQLNTPLYKHDRFQFRFINKCDYTVTDTMQFGLAGVHISSKIRIPFVDDFSTVKLYPSSERWLEKQVYINNDFAIAPPSVNVATFDGLDERGNPYGRGNGYLDTLTSLPLNLQGLTRADSVYLSFYVQPQGLGDIPEAEDSLVLEFRTSAFTNAVWQTVWSGGTAMFSTTVFTKVIVFVDSIFLHDDFQFRFKNYGSRTGNLDNWHIDYVILDKGRTSNDGYFDFALTNNPPSLLNKYSSMPLRHYQLAPSTYTHTLQQILVSNNDKPTVPMNFARAIYNPELTLIDSFINTDPGIAGESRGLVAITSLIGNLTTGVAASDSVLFSTKYYTNSNNNFDNIPTNDTLSIPTIMSNYFAYDDGTAEAGYALFNEPGSVALGYNLETGDTLYGISMFFNQSEDDVSTQSFNIMIWSGIGTNGDGTGETVIKRIAQSQPSYTNKRNGFYYLKLETPIYLPAGKFYIGWEQTTVFKLNMGLDLNYQIQGSLAVNPDMWFKMYDIWGKTQEMGALMMRPIVGKWIDPPVGLMEPQPVKQNFEVELYPNPAEDRVFVQTNFPEHEIEVSLTDITGKILLTEKDVQKSIPLSGITAGVYFVVVKDITTGIICTKKLLINP